MQPKAVLLPAPGTVVASYMRMSTDQQKYSIQNQRRTISRYADANGLILAHDYVDEGRSGLTLEHRKGLQSLLYDIRTGVAPFEAVLVLDVSRWGRFQNADESAFYEFLCWRAGVRVIYVAEPFGNDATPFSMVFKSIKRAMAAEYSRELSTKVSAGQRHLAALGFHQGAQAGYGLRRMMIDENGVELMTLARGDRKSRTTDRVRLVPGPSHEVELVRWIFDQCISGHDCTAIARQLNARGERTNLGKEWSYGAVTRILDSPRYKGDMVYCRTSKPLGGKEVTNPKASWVVKEGAFEGLVSRETFEAARRARVAMNEKPTDEGILAGIRALLAREGRITGELITKDPALPSSQACARHFGGLTPLYRVIGYRPPSHYRYAAVRQWISDWRRSLTGFAREFMEDDGSSVVGDGWTLTVDDAWTLSFSVLHASHVQTGMQWHNHRKPEATDIVVFALGVIGEKRPRRYLVLPRHLYPEWPRAFYLCNGPLADSCTYSSLRVLKDLARLSRMEVQTCG